MTKILALDDDLTTLKILSRGLTPPGTELITCQEIEAAEALLDLHSFDVVLADLCLSRFGGLDGMRFVRTVSARYPSTRIFVISGHTEPEIVRTMREYAKIEVVPKPFQLDKLAERVFAGSRASFPNLPMALPPGAVSHVDVLEEFLGRHEIHAVLQPIVSLRSIEPPFHIHGCESFARAPDESPLGDPVLLFGYAARKEMVYETDLQCIQASLAEGSALRYAPRLFVNVQPRSLVNRPFIEWVRQAVAESRLTPDRVVFELAEQQTIVNPVAFRSTLDALRGWGFQVALDGYGTGYSNLELVVELEPDYLKIAGPFAHNLENETVRQAVVRSTVEMADRIGVAVILEEVESYGAAEQARLLGVEFAQGHYFARPARASELAEHPDYILSTGT